MSNDTSLRGPLILPTGHELHWYEIVSVLGQGGFGITYLAHDKNLGRSVALKEYLPQMCAFRKFDMSVEAIDEDSREVYQWGLTSFMNEARTLAKFKHNNIVSVHSVFEHHNTAYMAMEYEVGQSLATLMKKGSLPDNQNYFSRLLMPIIDGLRLLHNAGFLHRDIKPSNIYIRQDGSPVLIDFGSSRETAQADTRDMTVLVSHGYTPIEQYSKGYGQQGPWTDIYALASSIYNACTGVRIQDAMERNALTQQGKPDPARPFSSLVSSNFSTEFMQAIDAALSIRLEDRPSSLDAWEKMFEPLDDATVLRPIANPKSTSEPTVEILDPQESIDGFFNDDDWDVSQSEVEVSSISNLPKTESTSSKKWFWATGLGLCSVLAIIAVWFFDPTGAFSEKAQSAELQELRLSDLPKPPVPLKTDSPVGILQAEIKVLSEQLSIYLQAAALAPDSDVAAVNLQTLSSRLNLLATSPLVQSHRQLREQLLTVLKTSSAAGMENQIAIDTLIAGQLTDVDAEQITTLLTQPSKTAEQWSSLIYGLLSLPESERENLAKLPNFAENILHFRNEIKFQLQLNNFSVAARMLELALLISPMDNELAAMKIHLE